MIVCIHGFKGFKDWGFWPETARRLCEAGYGAVRFNFSHSGLGEDPERFSETRLFETGTYSREVSDLAELLEALVGGRLPAAKRFDLSRVGLVAHSRGSVSALALAAARDSPARSVVLWNPVSSVLWWDGQTRGRWRQSGFWEVVNTRTGQRFHMARDLLDDAEANSERLDPVRNASRATAPILAVVAVGDETLSPDSGRRLARAAKAGALREIPSTGHTFGAAHPFEKSGPALEDALAATLEHFGRTLGGSE